MWLQGYPEQALERVHQALRLAGELDHPFSLAEVLFAEVEQEAEECFLTAIDIARKQQAKSLELRAVMSLARLWQQQNRKAESHQMLSNIYNWFTEGFDTKDLQEAKALIAELSD